ncbi:MAG: class I SAM-dependent methyltransferase [Gammaproteobacteria bacterium]|nr:class I SAM-dependent methyltransferase [Gammaproteobacteria bacterium]
MKLDQYFTPTWAAELLVQRHFHDLSENDVVADPACGDARFLMAVPAHVQAFGVEICQKTAAAAAINSGRTIINGDFRTVELPQCPTAFVGNPPFQFDLVHAFLERCHQLLEFGGRVGFILPVCMFQTANTVMRWSELWSIEQELIPRNIFASLRAPLMFATFTKEQRTFLSGFFLYEETASLEGLNKEFRTMFVGNSSRANVWRETVQRALEKCGGTATLQQLYQCIENSRPTPNQFWREKIRQTAAQYFVRVSRGEFALQQEAA